MVSILNSLPTWSVMLVFALLVLGMNEAGYWVGRTRMAMAASEGPSAVVQAAAYTLVGLLLGFSFSLALGRYDARRAAFTREANAINTAFLRTQLLDKNAAATERAYLRTYVAERIDFARADAKPQQRAAAGEKSSDVQRAMWTVAMTAARRDPRSTMTPLFIAALNDTIDLSTEEAAILQAHIPDAVIVGLVFIAMIASLLMGFGFGYHGHRGFLSKLFFAIALAIALGLILDLDRPQRGLVRVNLAPMQAVQQLMQR